MTNYYHLWSKEFGYLVVPSGTGIPLKYLAGPTWGLATYRDYCEYFYKNIFSRKSLTELPKEFKTILLLEGVLYG